MERVAVLFRCTRNSENCSRPLRVHKTPRAPRAGTAAYDDPKIELETPALNTRGASYL